MVFFCGKPFPGKSHFLDFSLTSCPDNICWLPVLLIRSLNNKVGSLNRNTYIHPQSPGWAGITFPHAKERSGRKWSHFGSGSDIWWRRTGTSLQPQEKDISRRNIKKEIPDHDISTILVYFLFLSDFKMCLAMRISMKEFSLTGKQ